MKKRLLSLLLAVALLSQLPITVFAEELSEGEAAYPKKEVLSVAETFEEAQEKIQEEVPEEEPEEEKEIVDDQSSKEETASDLPASEEEKIMDFSDPETASRFTVIFTSSGKTSYSATYTGSAITPEIKVYQDYVDADHVGSELIAKAKEDTEELTSYDYEISYEDNTEAGTGKVIITGVNAYRGNLVCDFQIKLAAPTIKVTKPSSKKRTIEWTGVTGASGYQIYRATSAKGTFVKVKTASATSRSFTNTKLNKKKNYYYKVRAYRKVGTSYVYGAFSTVKSHKSATPIPNGTTIQTSKGTWKYSGGYKLFYDQNGKLVKDVSSIIGKQSNYVIRVNKKMNTITVYAKDGIYGYIIPVKAFVCSGGKATPTGTFKTKAKYRWATLMGPSYGQWSTRIVGHILFHSVPYRKKNNNTLPTSSYNKLGTTCSHGCIRMTAGDVKWIYDNCKLKTKVIIYNSSNPGPFGKPSAYKLASWHSWDPTDPNMKYKCKEKGCH